MNLEAKQRYEKNKPPKFRIKELHFLDSNFLKYADYGLSLLGNLEGDYQQAAIEVKLKLVNSIFPDKLIFDAKKISNSRSQ